MRQTYIFIIVFLALAGMVWGATHEFPSGAIADYETGITITFYDGNESAEWSPYGNQRRYDFSAGETFYITDGCVVPFDNYLVNESIEMCPNSYYLNDSGKNGLLISNANDVEIDCQYSTYYSNTSDGFIFLVSTKTNTTLRNCNLYYFDRGVKLNYDGSSSKFYNNYFYGFESIASWGIEINNRDNCIVDNNTFIGGYRGIEASYGGNYNVLSNNKFHNLTNAGAVIQGNNLNATNNLFTGNATIQLEVYGNWSFLAWNIFNDTNNTAMTTYTHQNMTIYENEFEILDNGIAIRNTGYQSNITGNYVYGGWNGLNEGGSYTSAYDNIFKGITHSGLDLYENPDFIMASNGTYCNNYIGDSTTTWEFDLLGIYLGYAQGNIICNNTIANLQTLDTTSEVDGIKVDGNQTLTFNNQITGNTIQNIISSNPFKERCVQLSGTNNNFTDNTLDNCGRAIGLQNWFDSVEKKSEYSILRNTYLNINPVEYWIESPNYDSGYIINETNGNAYINLTNGTLAYLSFSGRKDLRVENNTITINQPSTYWQVFNGSSLPACENTNDCNETLASNERALVFTYATATQPKFTSIANTVTTLNYSLSSDTFSVTCTGSGSISYANLDYLGNIVYVYHNGDLVDSITGSTYTATSCSEWEFTGSKRTRFETENRPDYVEAYLNLAGMSSIFILALLVITVLLMVTGVIDVKSYMPNDWFEFFNEGIGTFLMVVFTVIIIILIVIAAVGIL